MPKKKKAVGAENADEGLEALSDAQDEQASADEATPPSAYTDSEDAEETGEEAAAENSSAAKESSPILPVQGLVLPPSKRIEKILASKAMAAIVKEHGKNLLMRASEHRAREVHYIPADVWSVDRALGGGWLVGRIHTVYGPKQGGKTTLILRSIAQAQRMCANCWTYADFTNPKKPQCGCGKYRDVVAAYIDVEGTYDEAWAMALGILPDRLLLAQPEFAEQSLDVGEALLRSGELDVLALDSLAFLTPAKEIEESTAKDMMGVQARAIGRGVRKFVMALNWAGNRGRRPTIFFTNQIRMKLGLVFGNPETQSGGLAAGFSATSELRLATGKYEMEPTPKDAPTTFMARPLYVDMNFKVEKLKANTPRMEGSYRLVLSDTETKKKGSVADEGLMVDTAEELGLIKKEHGAWTFLGEEFSARSKIQQSAMVDPLFRHKLRSTLLSVIPR